ncbi:MAG: hypothetical protein N3D11_05455 [Candidatus Sumerlaeia bacterium]|nr:hypothetical protein [Candidatus Sumerlaeia bacterium]
MPSPRPIRVADYTRRFRILLGLAVVLSSVAGLAAANWWNLNRYFYAYAQCKDIRRTVEKQKAIVAQLEWEKRQLEFSPFEIEKAVRESDKAVRPGENLIFLRRVDRPSSPTAAPLIQQNNH